MLTFGDFLKFIRNRHNLIQSEMGDLFYRNKDYIYKIENDKIMPTDEEIMTISKKLDEPILLVIMYGLSVTKLIEIKNTHEQ